MSAVTIEPARSPLRGTVRVPGDKSISHRALLFGGLAEGRSVVRGLSAGEDVRASAAALAQLGVGVEGTGEGAYVLEGGRSRLREAAGVIDLGNSGTGMRLFCGICASLPFLSILVGDASLSNRPMDRVAVPLRSMGARIDGREQGRLAPLVVRGGDLAAIDYAPPVASAQVKTAILLAGLAASGTTVVREAVATRRHTEEFLERCGASITVDESSDGYVVRLEASELAPFELEVPGDPSQAAFLIVAACVVPGSDVLVENLYVGPGRAGFLEVLAEMGADLEVRRRDATTADVRVRYSPLRATRLDGRLVADSIDEIPVLCVAAAFASGTTVVADAAELRVKESDRIESVRAGLAALGIEVVAHPDGLEVTGGTPHAGTVHAALDHRIAMSFAIAALGATGPVAIEGFESVASSWPSFRDDLEALR